MEKFFRPNRIFIIFCLLLIVVWLGLQYVSNLRITDAAAAEAQEIFDWSWPQQVSSTAEITDVAVLSKSENEAKVRVKAKQTLTKLVDSKDTSSSDTACVLTLYRFNRNWILGKVEFD